MLKDVGKVVGRFLVYGFEVFGCEDVRFFVGIFEYEG